MILLSSTLFSNSITPIPNNLKVDKSFVDNIPTDNNNLQISKAIIALSES